MNNRLSDTLSHISRRRFFAAMALGAFAASLSRFFPTSFAHAASSGRGGKTLIVYYSWSGNTRQIASQVHEIIPAADLVELQTVVPYPAEYRQTTEQAKKEQQANYRPPLSTKIDNLDQYSTIFIGSPNWWGTVSMPVFTFLDEYDLSGKTVGVFITHEGSRLGRAVEDVQKRCAGGKILEGLAVRGGSVGSARPEVAAWLRKVAPNLL